MAALRVLSVLCLLALAASAGAAPNLVTNPGFEEGDRGWRLPPTYSVVSDTAHTGRQSLRVVNTDPSKYLLAAQTVPCTPGRAYRFGAWVKTQGVKGDENGATVCMEWSGANGWMGGEYPAGSKGDSDWKRVEGVTGRIPAGATSVTVTVYLRKGMTGTAWFDDVTVEPYSMPFDAAILEPAYRETLWAGDPSRRIVARAQVPDEVGGIPAARLVVRCYVIETDSEPNLRAERAAGKAGPCDLEMDASRLAPGTYDLVVSVGIAGSKLGEELVSKHFRLAWWVDVQPRPAVYIDSLRRAMVDGKPFFPLGLYFGPGPDDADFRQHLDRVAASPFNTVMPYGINGGSIDKVRTYLDYLAAHKLKILYSIKDNYAGTTWFKDPVLGFSGEKAITRGIVTAFKDHPALLGWYLNDELPLAMKDRLEARYREVRDLDPGHPTWAVLYQVDQMAGYVGTADVLGSDPYPVSKNPVTMAAEWAQKTFDAAGGRRAVWQVPQAHDWSVYLKDAADRQRAPTLDEMMVMSYLALIHGAKGLIYYSYFDLQRDRLGFDKRWADMLVVSKEMKSIEPAVLSSRGKARADVQVAQGKVDWAAMEDDRGRRYVLLANTDGGQEATVRIGIPRGAALRLLQHAEETAVPFQADGQPFSLVMKPMSAATLIISPS